MREDRIRIYVQSDLALIFLNDIARIAVLFELNNSGYLRKIPDWSKNFGIFIFFNVLFSLSSKCYRQRELCATRLSDFTSRTQNNNSARTSRRNLCSHYPPSGFLTFVTLYCVYFSLSLLYFLLLPGNLPG